MQVAKVTKPLLSVKDMIAQNKRVVFEKNAAYMEDTNTGEIQYFDKVQDGWALGFWMEEPTERIEGARVNALDFPGQEVVDL